jgi:hypothetical protein
MRRDVSSTQDFAMVGTVDRGVVANRIARRRVCAAVAGTAVPAKKE